MVGKDKLAAPACSMPLPLPPSVPCYDIRDHIGDGGQCQVFIGRHSNTGALVALKLGHPVDEETNPIYQVHLAEYQTYKQLGAVMSQMHSAQENGIASVYGRGLMTVEDQQVRPWMAMQLLDCSLDKLVGGFVSNVPSMLFRYARQMLTALEYCHKHGILHRDVKPGNFCLDTGGRDEMEALATARVVLVDFGFARPMDASLNLAADFGGTPDYASTRSLMSQTIGPSDDLESLGYALLELWTGKELPWDVTLAPNGKRVLPSGGWTRQELAGFATKRQACWETACAKQVMLERCRRFRRAGRWVERAKALLPGQEPDYGGHFRSLLVEAADACAVEE